MLRRTWYEQIFFLICFVMLSFVWIGCQPRVVYNDPNTEIGKILKGRHRLRKMYETKTSSKEWSASGGFFLIAGAVSARGEEALSYDVIFSWELPDTTYIISKLPLWKLRIKFSDDAVVPTIEFAWKEDFWDETEYQRNISRPYNPYLASEVMEYVSYAVIICKEEDWPPNVILPLSSGEVPSENG